MKDFIKKNKFFMTLLAIMIIITAALVVYDVQKWYKSALPNEDNKEEEVQKPSEETTAITSFTGDYQRLQSGNLLYVQWNYSEAKDKVESVYLTLNDGNPIDVTNNRYYEFIQNVFAFPTGNNVLKLSLNLESGKVIEKEITVFVDYLISAQQTALRKNEVVEVTLEYVYGASNPVEVPKILITSMGNSIAPKVEYMDTVKENQGTYTKAITKYRFTWEKEEQVPESMNLRWKFNHIQDSYDFTLQKPINSQEEEHKEQADKAEEAKETQKENS